MLDGILDETDVQLIEILIYKADLSLGGRGRGGQTKADYRLTGGGRG